VDEAEQRVQLPGSQRDPVPGARRVGDVAGDEMVELSLILRRNADADADAALAELASLAPRARTHLEREQFAARFGASAGDLEAVTALARSHGLEVVEADAARRTVRVRGPVATLSELFGVKLGRYETADGVVYRGREGSIAIPRELAGVVTAVLGFDDRPQAAPRLRRADPSIRAPRAAHSFDATELAALYDFPAGSASGQWIAIVELGGGFKQADLDQYFQRIGRATPEVVAISVDGATNSPVGDPGSADGEVLLDIEVAAAVAPDASIAVYFAPNSAKGFTDAVTTAAHDRTRNPGVVSISWGARENAWTGQAMTSMDQAFADAALLGVTVCAAAGDNGTADGATDRRAHADFPASSPHVLACGGTRLEGSGTAITSEVVWNDGSGGATGGGVSDVFPLPSWQSAANVPVSVNPGGRVGRGVPDVAGDADPATGYRVRVDGVDTTFGGTSAVSPLWAGLIALINAIGGVRLGFVNPDLYRTAAGSGSFRDVTQGDNAVPRVAGYPARPGWDACTGLGTPRGKALMRSLGVG
jgi:kumamolisin